MQTLDHLIKRWGRWLAGIHQATGKQVILKQNAPVNMTGAFYIWAENYFVQLCLLQRADTRGAEALGNSLAIGHNLHFLDIDVPAASGRLTRPRSIITELWAAATTLTFRHDEAPFTNLLTAHGACGARARFPG
jgi:hypothetical protein